MTSFIDWVGKSGKPYRYWFLADITADTITAIGGNYAFVKQLAKGKYVPIYFGESTCLPNRDRWAEGVRAGATHIMAHITPGGETARLAEEHDLIQQWNPPLNIQYGQVS